MHEIGPVDEVALERNHSVLGLDDLVPVDSSIWRILRRAIPNRPRAAPCLIRAPVLRRAITSVGGAVAQAGLDDERGMP